MLRENPEIHDLMVGAVSIKMLAESAIIEYSSVIKAAINASVNSGSNAILNEEDLELVRT